MRIHGTIHRYEISGGKRKFLRFIGCYLGQCNFHKNIDEAIDYIKNLKELQNIQKKMTWRYINTLGNKYLSRTI